MAQFSYTEMQDILNTCYEGVQVGTPGSRNCYQIAREYLETYNDPKEAASRLSDNQAAKYSTTGFFAGLGGFMTKKEDDEVAVAGVLNHQMRLAASIALMSGRDLDKEETKTMIYACLVDPELKDILEGQGNDPALLDDYHLRRSVPEDVNEQVKRTVTAELIRKFSNLGFSDFIRAVPVAGGLASIRSDYKNTQNVGRKAADLFLAQA